MNAQHDEKSKRGFHDLPSDHHIRVLHLSPASVWVAPLHAFIEVQDLDERPYYEALSYTWMDENGDATLSRRLYVGTGWDVLPITESCSHALRRLRLERTARPVWVDSVCINQLNNVEKSHQIALMRTIYARSIRCVVDLGEPSSDTDAAIDYANGQEYNEPIGQIKQELGEDALWILFRRKYFNSTSESIRLNWVREFGGAIATGRPTSAYNGHSGLLQLLRDTVDSESSDPRDKIFALLGLVRGLDREGITPDYNLTYVQVYTGLAAYFIKNHGLTGLIMMKPQEDVNLPSWVPDWRALREVDWTKFDIRSGKLRTEKNVILSEKAKLGFMNEGDAHENVRRLIPTTNLPSKEPYRPEIHAQTGALIHAASCVFSFLDPRVKMESSTVYTKVIWAGNKHDMARLSIVTLKPVIVGSDTIAYLPGQNTYIHLRKKSLSAYRILGEAMIFLHQLSKQPAIRYFRNDEDSTNNLDLFMDCVTIWREKVSIASELWHMFKDRSGSRGIRATCAWETEIPCMFYYRADSLEEAHEQYLSFKSDVGNVEILRRWIKHDAQCSVPPVITDLIKCILYWQKPHSWENVAISLSPTQIAAKSHPKAWINLNVIRQRWLAIERILAEYYEINRTHSAYLRERPPVADQSEKILTEHSEMNRPHSTPAREHSAVANESKEILTEYSEINRPHSAPPKEPPAVLDQLSMLNSAMKNIVEIWKDLTSNLVVRLNVISDATGLEPFSQYNETQTQGHKFNKECDEFLNSTFTNILQQLDKTSQSCTRPEPATSHHQTKVSRSSTVSQGNLGKPQYLIGPPSSDGCHAAWWLDHDNLLENATHKRCPVCVDLHTHYNAISWEEHWKTPKSRSDIKKMLRALRVSTYGDRRRMAIQREPNARREAQVLGSLLDLIMINIPHEYMLFGNCDCFF
ncbi:heterokaryon incompatibility protein-domain-containing protein [Xylaria telfairii]|nr:heterokaryon incompatibility protein-domain-containing protein [Xylaria telfairii]